MTRVIGVISAKGGVGKTTTVANLGVIAAAELGKRVLVVDANIGAPNLGMCLGIINPPVTLHDVLQDRFSICRSIHTHSSGLHVLPASFSGDLIDAKNLRRKLEEVFQDYDVIFIDSAPGIGNEVVSVMKASHELLIVTNPELSAVTTTLKSIKLANDLKISITGVVINRMTNKGYEMSKLEVGDCLDVLVISTVPEDPMVPEAISHGVPVTQYSPDSRSSEEFRALTTRLLGEKYTPEIFVRIKMLFSSVRNFFH